MLNNVKGEAKTGKNSAVVKIIAYCLGRGGGVVIFGRTLKIFGSCIYTFRIKD
jgi:hypothetical protein